MDTFADLFQEPEPPKYPGSKRIVKGAIKTPVEKPKVSRAIELFDPENWGHKPFIKKVGGKDVRLYTFGALASALGRPLITLRMWEQQGYLPDAPFRAAHVPGKGGTAGRRYYTRSSITAALEEFHKRGLLGVSRIEWCEHMDLPEAIKARWDQIIEDFESGKEYDE